MAYDLTDLTNLKQLKKLANKTKEELSKLNVEASNSIKAATYANNTLKFFRTIDTTKTADFSFDLPEEMFLDQAKTEFVADFKWSATAYPGSTNPNLDGKQVMVLAVKGDAENPNYSFLDVSHLMNVYTAADKSIVIDGYTIKANISKAENNAITLKDDGLHVDISGKADRVKDGTADNLAGLDADGNLKDSGVAAANVQQKIANPTAGHIVTVDANGFVQDGGVTIATDAEVDEMLTEVFGEDA